MEAIKKLKEKLEKYPQLSVAEDDNEITIKAQSDKGFDITLIKEPNEYTVLFGKWHGHFDTDDEVLNYIAFGLSDECRVRELWKGDMPYKWIIECSENDKWIHCYTTGLLWYPFWKPEREIILQNHVITR